MLECLCCAGQPDKAGTPLLMAMHQQQAALRTGPTPSPSLPHQQPALSGHTSSPTLSLLPGQAQQEAMQQPGQAQQSGYQSRRSQQVAISPLDPAFRLLTDAEKTKRLREFLLGVKPNLQPLDMNQLLIASGRGDLSDQVKLTNYSVCLVTMISDDSLSCDNDK